MCSLSKQVLCLSAVLSLATGNQIFGQSQSLFEKYFLGGSKVAKLVPTCSTPFNRMTSEKSVDFATIAANGTKWTDPNFVMKENLIWSKYNTKGLSAATSKLVNVTRLS